MRVFIVGHGGMLGHVVTRRLSEQGLNILTTPLKYSGDRHDALIAQVVEEKPDWIINASGKTARQAANRRDLFLVNTQLPIHLKSILQQGQKLIHASTDGVFSGKTGKYSVGNSSDAEDDYGLSKSLAEIVSELGSAISIRCSIIGPDPEKKRGLMEWFLQQTGPVEGYVNHRWNGITTLEWAKICHELITNQTASSEAILQPTSTAVSKFELLKMIAETYRRPVEVVAKPAPDKIDRTLISNFPRSSLKQQLQELKEWY